MKKNALIVFALLINLYGFAQEIKPMSKGFITVTTGQKMPFTNLRIIDNQVIFMNVETKTEFTYFVANIKQLEDMDKNVIYTKKTIEKTEPKKEVKIVNDSLFRPNYPEGIYKTKEDFINKKPTETVKIVAKGLVGFEKPFLNNIEHNCFFYYNATDEKIKNVFAVSYNGHLYFQVNAILSNRNKNDRAQTNSQPNGFVRVIMGGVNYFYTEANLVNQWAQGLAYSGGAIGGALASNMVHGKGVVWDFKNQEFNIFKNCEDYNDFVKEKYSDGLQDCPNQQPNVLEIRKVIAKIK